MRLVTKLGLCLVLVLAVAPVGAAAAAPAADVADLGVTITAPTTTVSGGYIEVQYAVTNDGSVDADNVGVTLSQPTGAQGTDCTQTQGPVDQCGADGFTVGVLRAGATASMSERYRVTADDSSVVTFTADIAQSSISALDENTTNDSASVSAYVVAAPTTADLSLTSTGPTSVEPGQDAHYVITLTNAGPSAASVIRVRFGGSSAFPDIAVHIPQGPPDWTCNGDCTGALDANASVTFTLTVQVVSTAKAGDTFSAFASIADSSVPDPTYTDDSTSFTTTIASTAPPTTTEPSNAPTTTASSPSTSAVAASELPRTGGSVVPPVLFALALLLNGALYLALAHRRIALRSPWLHR